MRKYILVILCFTVLLIYQCNKIKDFKNTETKNLDAFSDTLGYYKNKLNTQTATIKTLNITTHQIKNTLLLKDKELTKLIAEFKKVHTVTKYISSVIIDTMKVRYKDTIPCNFERFGKIQGDWYNFTYNSTQNAFEIDSLTISTQTTMITGIKKKWLLGPQILTTDITNTNPYIKITGIKSAEIKINEPWYKKWYIWLITGIICGEMTAR